MAKWLTAPFESVEGENLVMCTVRADIAQFRSNPKFKYRVEVEWPYGSDANGMPTEAAGGELEAVTEALLAVFNADPVAVMTGIYTGDGRRTMVFYTLSLFIFQKKINEALGEFPMLPLSFEAFEDPEWEEYSGVRQSVDEAEAAASAGIYGDDMAESD